MKCRTILEVFTYCILVPTSIFFNLLALFVLKKVSSKKLTPYKVVFVAICLVDLTHIVFLFLLGLVSCVRAASAGSLVPVP